MPTEIDGRVFYRTKEVCELAGISRATLFRWLKSGLLANARYRDRRGWRLFDEEDVRTVKKEANRLRIDPSQGGPISPEGEGG